jgi:hypothetical protein
MHLTSLSAVEKNMNVEILLKIHILYFLLNETPKVVGKECLSKKSNEF